MSAIKTPYTLEGEPVVSRCPQGRGKEKNSLAKTAKFRKGKGKERFSRGDAEKGRKKDSLAKILSACDAQAGARFRKENKK